MRPGANVMEPPARSWRLSGSYRMSAPSRSEGQNQ